MTSEQCAARAADHENRIAALESLLQRYEALLWLNKFNLRPSSNMSETLRLDIRDALGLPREK